MIVGHHLIWTAYGWWLPNDPRGSMSKELRKVSLMDLGEIHFGRKRIQPAGRDLRKFFEAARQVLKHSLLKFTREEVMLLADTFADVIQKNSYTCYACAIMPEHIHLLIRRHRHMGDEMIERFQDATCEAFHNHGYRSLDHPVWGGPGWRVYLDSVEDMRRTIHYIERNPIVIGLPAQSWSFVKEYDGWPPGGGRAGKSQVQKRGST